MTDQSLGRAWRVPVEFLDFPVGHGNVIRVKLNGVILGDFDHDAVGRIRAFGSAGNDKITMPLNLGKVAEFHGDQGNDTLTSGAGADKLFGGEGDDKLSGNGGNDLLFGEGGNDQLFGQNGNDILLGGSGNDLLNGGRNRDLLIGGLGLDKLVGDGGDDILIGGTTTHDANELALKSVLAEWTSANDYATRVANIRVGGGLSAGFKLAAVAGATVFDDFSVDLLFGGKNSDWFFNVGAANDLAVDKVAGELVN